MKISAVIFDLDGTVIDSDSQWSKAFVEVLKQLGKNVEEKSPQVSGASLKSNWAILLDRYNIKTSKSVDELESLTEREYLKQISTIELQRGVLDFIQSLKDSGVKVALATSTDWWVVEKIFDYLGIEDLFESVTTGEEVLNKKPAPDSFLTAAEKLGILSEECVVIEDSPVGIEAAKLAEMKVIGVDETGEKKLDDADLVVEGFSEISPQVLSEL